MKDAADAPHGHPQQGRGRQDVQAVLHRDAPAVEEPRRGAETRQHAALDGDAPLTQVEEAERVGQVIVQILQGEGQARARQAHQDGPQEHIRDEQ